MSEPVITKPRETEQKKPVIFGQEIQRKEGYWFARFNNGWNSLSVGRTSKEQAKADEQNVEWHKKVQKTLKDLGRDTGVPPITCKEGEIVVTLNTVEWYARQPIYRFNAMLGISGEGYEHMRTLRETADFGIRGRDAEPYKWLDEKQKQQILSEVQDFLLRNPKGIAWVREMEEKDNRLFRKIKPKD